MLNGISLTLSGCTGSSTSNVAQSAERWDSDRNVVTIQLDSTSDVIAGRCVLEKGTLPQFPSWSKQFTLRGGLPDKRHPNRVVLCWSGMTNIESYENDNKVKCYLYKIVVFSLQISRLIDLYNII